MFRRAAITLALLVPSLGVAQLAAHPVNRSAAFALAPSAEPAKSFDALLGMFEGEALAVVRAMPADKYDFAPSAGTFAATEHVQFAGVRSFGAQAKHIASANYYFFGTASGLKPDVDMKAIDNLKTKDEIVAALQASFVFAHKAMAKLTAANAFEEVDADGKQTRVSAAAFGIGHGFDHYGQMVEYLRMNGIVPPGSK